MEHIPPFELNFIAEVASSNIVQLFSNKAKFLNRFWKAATRMPSFDCQEHCQAPDEFYSGSPWVSKPENKELYARAGKKLQQTTITKTTMAAVKLKTAIATTTSTKQQKF